MDRDISDLDAGAWVDEMALSLSTASVGDLSKRLTEKREAKLQQAIRETDWTEHDILDAVMYRSDTVRPTEDGSPRFTLSLGEMEFHRYTGEAPPLSVYADGSRTYEVQRITRPLLETLVDEGKLPADYL